MSQADRCIARTALIAKPLSQKRCMVYCGDERCDCEANPALRMSPILGVNKMPRPGWKEIDNQAAYEYALRWQRSGEPPPVDPEEWARMQFDEARLSLLTALGLTRHQLRQRRAAAAPLPDYS